MLSISNIRDVTLLAWYLSQRHENITQLMQRVSLVKIIQSDARKRVSY